VLRHSKEQATGAAKPAAARITHQRHRRLPTPVHSTMYNCPAPCESLNRFLRRSMMRRQPSGVSSPMSPVWKKPSASASRQSPSQVNDGAEIMFDSALICEQLRTLRHA